MTSDLVIAGLAIATGFVSAGILASFYQLVTAEPARFDKIGDRLVTGVAMIILLMFAGPMILMRNAIRGKLIEQRAAGWMAASTVIAAGWSLCSGTVLLQLILAVRYSLL
jgi:hypothetical protein